MGGVSMEFYHDILENLLDKLIDYRGKTPKKTLSGVPLVTAKIVKNGTINGYTEYIAEEDYDKWMVRGFPKVGDVILTTEAPLGEVALLKEEKVALAQRIVCLRGKDNVLDNTYLKYYLQSGKGQKSLSARESGTTVTGIKQAELRRVDIEYPAYDDQRRIASILSSLDRKIELNNKINADLEEMAQAIFKNWFVDFEPFKDGKFVNSELGMIPEGWKVGTLGDFCKCLLGGTPSRSKEEYWNGDVNWINSGEINKFRILEASEKITELGLSKSATKLLPKKTTVLAITGATLGQVSLLEIDTCANQSVIGVLENAEVPYEYIYPFIKDRIEMLIQHQTGGAQQHINKDNVESLIFLLPAKNVLENYISLVGPMYKRIESQCFENLYLSTFRDTLLPRLMSGELEVPE